MLFLISVIDRQIKQIIIDDNSRDGRTRVNKYSHFSQFGCITYVAVRDTLQALDVEGLNFNRVINR